MKRSTGNASAPERGLPFIGEGANANMRAERHQRRAGQGYQRACNRPLAFGVSVPRSVPARICGTTCIVPSTFRTRHSTRSAFNSTVSADTTRNMRINQDQLPFDDLRACI
ncbi:hypothetical protein [Burkholderia territorii]|uniref:hypothetical protein n=1 Tax=Burkholderia territorii TaxID=1503055 RepID=UPI0012DA3532|nr:hypothetical protein [Burkholderia territorii]